MLAGVQLRAATQQPANEMYAIRACMLAAALGIAKFTQMDQAGIEDRVYRLHFNQGQNRTDQFAQV